ncbi:hypothetical protein TNCV_3076651 [Trichonephila clavipes]|nr:hypothetical protein TNCV_3076651 [Trichonephila clavipes]
MNFRGKRSLLRIARHGGRATMADITRRYDNGDPHDASQYKMQHTFLCICNCCSNQVPSLIEFITNSAWIGSRNIDIDPRRMEENRLV